MSREILSLLEEDQVEAALMITTEKLSKIKYLSENKNNAEELKQDSFLFASTYADLDEIIVKKVQKIKTKIDDCLRKGRVTGRKLYTYESVRNNR